MNPQLCPFCEQPLNIPEDLHHLHLTPRILRCVRLLYKSSPEMVPREVFGLTRKTLDVYIHLIRDALKDCGSEWYIDTFYGLGYRLRKYSDGKDNSTERPKIIYPRSRIRDVRGRFEGG